MLKTRTAGFVIAALGGGCAAACVIIATLGVLLLRTTASALPASDALQLPTQVSDHAPNEQAGAATADGAPLAQVPTSSQAAPQQQASMTVQAPGASTPAFVSPAATAGAGTPTPAPLVQTSSAAPTAAGTPSATPTRTQTPTRTPTPTRTASPTRVPSPTRTPSSTPLPPTAAPSDTPTPAASGGMRVLSVAYASGTLPNTEHIRLVNCAVNDIDLSGWQVKSMQTGDVYTVPAGVVARRGCRAAVQITVNTHTTGNENAAQGIYSWDRPADVEEWPKKSGRVQVIDSSGAVVIDCRYTPDPNQSEVTCQ